MRTPTAFLKAKGGTAFKLYEEWRKLSYEEQCLWAMEGRWLNKENDEEHSKCLWVSQLLLLLIYFWDYKLTRPLFLLSKIAVYEPKTGPLGSTRLYVSRQGSFVIDNPKELRSIIIEVCVFFMQWIQCYNCTRSGIHRALAKGNFEFHRSFHSGEYAQVEAIHFMDSR